MASRGWMVVLASLFAYFTYGYGNQTDYDPARLDGVARHHITLVSRALSFPFASSGLTIVIFTMKFSQFPLALGARYSKFIEIPDKSRETRLPILCVRPESSVDA